MNTQEIRPYTLEQALETDEAFYCLNNRGDNDYCDNIVTQDDMTYCANCEAYRREWRQ